MPMRSVARVRRTAQRLALLLIASLGYIEQTIAEPQCEYRTGFPALFTGQAFAGMFQITQDPPDYHNPVSVQRHLIFSTIRGQLLRSELFAQSGGLCSGYIRPYAYPNLQASLVVRGLGTDPGARCEQFLRNIVVRWEPITDAVRQTAQAEAESMTSWRENRSGDSRTAAWLLLSSALPLIYKENTLLHSLVTVYANGYRSLDVDAFVVWLRRQQSFEKNGLDPIAHCQPQGETEAAAEKAETEKLRNYSEIAAPGTMRVPGSSGGPLAKSGVRRLVVIGNADAPSNLQITSPATTKYCERQQSISLNDADASSRTKMVRVLCVRDSVNDLDTWIGLFCDPRDCSSKQEEEAVLAAIMGDAAVLMHARGTWPAHPRGPYLIEVDAAR